MQYRKEVKQAIVHMIATKLDEPLARYGFARTAKAMDYHREVENVKQVIAINFQSHPSFYPGVDAYIYPWLVISIPHVDALALQLVRDPWLLDNDPCRTFSQPMDWAAPKVRRPTWTAIGEDKIIKAGDSILSFIEEWVLRFLSDYSTPEGIVRGFEGGDERPIMTRATFVRIAAAYLLLNNPEGAKRILDQKLGNSLFKKKYVNAFEYVEGILGTKAVANKPGGHGGASGLGHDQQ